MTEFQNPDFLATDLAIADLGTTSQQVFITRSKAYPYEPDSEPPEGFVAVESCWEGDRVLNTPFLTGQLSLPEEATIRYAINYAGALHSASSYGGMYVCATGALKHVDGIDEKLAEMMEAEVRNFRRANIRSEKIRFEVLRDAQEAGASALAARHFLLDRFPESRKGTVFFAALGGSSTRYGFIDQGEIGELGYTERGILSLSGEVSHGNETPELAADRVLSKICAVQREKGIDLLAFGGSVTRALYRFAERTIEIKKPNMLSSEDVRRVSEILSSTSSTVLEELYDVGDTQARRLHAAALLLQGLMKMVQADTVVVPDCGFREGLIIKLTDRLPVWVERRSPTQFINDLPSSDGDDIVMYG